VKNCAHDFEINIRKHQDLQSAAKSAALRLGSGRTPASGNRSISLEIQPVARNGAAPASFGG